MGELADFFYAMDLLGTLVFAISGGLAAVRKDLDLYGVLVLAGLTALGGGMLRDLLLGIHPPTAFQQVEYLGVASIGGLFAFFFSRWLEHFAYPLIFLDAVGLGIFTIIGTYVAIKTGVSEYSAVLMGLLSGTGGGMLRDVLRKEVPFVLQKEVYALAAVAGAGIYVLMGALDLPQELAASVGTLATIVLRVLAKQRDWHLPKAKT